MTAPQALTVTPAEYQAAQSGLAGSLSAQVLAAWDAVLDVQALAATLPAFSAAAAALVQRYGQASAAVASGYYESARLAAGVTGRYTVVPAQPAGLQQVTKNVGYATKGLWSAQPDVQAAKTLTVGSVTRLTLDTGRNTVIGAVKADRQATGWMRVTRPGCCYFCAMLASRGAVYRSDQSATFSAHDHDQCTAAPVFGAYKPSADVRDLQKLWRSSTKGTSGDDAIRAFRQAYEGRQVTAPKGAPSGAAKAPARRAGKATGPVVPQRAEAALRQQAAQWEAGAKVPGLSPGAVEHHRRMAAQLRKALGE